MLLQDKRCRARKGKFTSTITQDSLRLMARVENYGYYSYINHFACSVMLQADHAEECQIDAGRNRRNR